MGTPNNLLYAVARDLALCLDGLGGLGVSVGVGGLCLTVVVFLRGVGLLSGCPLGDGGRRDRGERLGESTDTGSCLVVGLRGGFESGLIWEAVVPVRDCESAVVGEVGVAVGLCTSQLVIWPGLIAPCCQRRNAIRSLTLYR